MLILLFSLAVLFAWQGTPATAKDGNPIFGGAKVTTLSKDQSAQVVGKGYYADLYGYYGNYYANYASYYGLIAAYVKSYSYYYYAYLYAYEAGYWYYYAYVNQYYGT
jgi:hypothetical protein